MMIFIRMPTRIFIRMSEKMAAGNEAQRSDRIEVASDFPLLSGHCAIGEFGLVLCFTDPEGVIYL